MSNNCNTNNICPNFNIQYDDSAFKDNTDTSYNIYGLNSASIIEQKKIAAQLKCADLKRMTKVQKYTYEAKGFLFKLN